MKNVVMGTAGHIDHGKTALVKRLTGIDTDRLEEEKRRGMTIELGFAPLTLPSGSEISIIDVPGHEKFVRTMVAGVTGIDFVMLVVAADEGIMPQTKEHIDILSLLNVQAGVVALTKTDLVDAEWLDMVREDVRKAIVGTTLEGLPVIPVSSVTGSGINELAGQLELLAENASKASVHELFRLPIDRVFTMTGYGTVITGTVSGGKITKGDVVEILPEGLTARIRGIQVHNRNVEYAGAGDRCALNLSGVEKADIKKGDVAASQGAMRPTGIADAVLYTVKGREGVIHNQRVHVHVGTKEVLARIRLLGTEKIPGGSKGYVQLRFEEPVPILRKDRFIIRSHSPVYTIGGGWVIYHSAHNRQRFSEQDLKALETGERGEFKELVQYFSESSGKIFNIDDLWRELFADRNEIQKVLELENAEGSILKLRETNKYLSAALYKDYINKINAEFEQLYKKYPFRFQIDREEIKSKVLGSTDAKDFAALLNRLIEDRQFELDRNYIIQPEGIGIKRITAMKETQLTEKAVLDKGLNAGSLQQLQPELRIEASKFSEIVKFLIETGKVLNLGNDILMHKDTFKKSVDKIRSIIDEQGGVTAAQVRDCLGTGRKTAIAILEYLDTLEVTERVDDNRKPGVHFRDYFI